MTASPAVSAVRKAVPESTEATAGSEELQVRLRTSAVEGFRIAFSCMDDPVSSSTSVWSIAWPWSSLMPMASTGMIGWTLTLAEADNDGSETDVAVTVTMPSLTAVTRPDELTVATEASLVVQTTD
ncbi:hypothetical protein D3C71_1549030 [compost metagenome]